MVLPIDVRQVKLDVIDKHKDQENGLYGARPVYGRLGLLAWVLDACMHLFDRMAKNALFIGREMRCIC